MADEKKPKSKSANGRPLRVRVKTAGGRKISSTRWLERQLNDPYVAEAKAKGYRSRAAFKLEELDDKFHFLKKGAKVLDLGAAPGGWSQVAKARIGASGSIVATDILEIAPIPDVLVMQLDTLAKEAPEAIRNALGGKADVVLSDMAASTTGHRETDHIRTTALFEAALETAEDVLKPGGVFVGKLFQGGAAPALLARLKRVFREVKHVKPPASRTASVELYLVATGFRGK
ncbi:MAG: ribosomal large subunit methyltransferase [Pseudomonadota bacterium]|jgi:23S rRNA (uridine2552-2'-O)-methyltransferase